MICVFDFGRFLATVCLGRLPLMYWAFILWQCLMGCVDGLLVCVKRLRSAFYSGSAPLFPGRND
jgi:hypothetical protein